MATPVLTITLPHIPYFIEGEAARVLNELVQLHMKLALQTVAGYVSDAAPVNVGHLGQSFMSDPATSTGGIEVLGTDVSTGVSGRVFSSLPYAIVMEDGRRPGARMPPVGALTLWVQRQLGISDDKAAESAAWAIAISISRRGITGRHYAQRGVAAAQTPVQAIWDTLGEAIVTVWGMPS